MTDNEIIKALECCTQNVGCNGCPFNNSIEFIYLGGYACAEAMRKSALNLIKRQKAEIERLQYIKKHINDVILEDCVPETPEAYNMCFQKLIKKLTNTKAAKSETIKEFEEKITEIFKRYAHIHSFAEAARKDSIEAFDGTEIEMQSVWDVFTLKEHELVEYEEMGRLQSNIEVIEKERLLTELEKDFSLLLKEMVGDEHGNKSI